MPCSYATEKGSYAADCGTLVVPENRANPRSRLIALPVTRIRARSAHPGTPIFRLEGGPGITNMQFKKASRFADHHDVVLVGYRGVDGSVRLDCPEVGRRSSTRPTSSARRRFARTATRSGPARTDSPTDGVDLAGYGLAQRVDDLEAARMALGYHQIDLLSESADTRTAMIYAWRYPRSIHRSVMIGVNPPGHFLWDPKTTDEQIRRYAAPVRRRTTTCSTRTDDLAATMKRTAGPHPRPASGSCRSGGATCASPPSSGSWSRRSEAAPLSAPMTLDSWLSAANGDASGLWFAVARSRPHLPDLVRLGRYVATVVRRRPGRERYYAAGDDPATRSSATRGRTSPGVAAVWSTRGRPVPTENEYRQVRTSDVRPSDRRGARLRDAAAGRDTGTPPLPPERSPGCAGRLRAHDLLLERSAESGTRLINTFLDNGKVDHSLLHARDVDFTPDVTQTALAKGIAGTMVGLAVLTVLSLLRMSRRAHARTLRPHGERDAAVAVPARPRPGRMVPRPPDRPARVPASRSTTRSSPPSRWACRRAGDLSRLGGPRPARHDQGRPAGGCGGRSHRRLARVPAATGLLAIVTTIVGAAAGRQPHAAHPRHPELRREVTQPRSRS